MDALTVSILANRPAGRVILSTRRFSDRVAYVATRGAQTLRSATPWAPIASRLGECHRAPSNAASRGRRHASCSSREVDRIPCELATEPIES